jgi:predicted AlkP superfamily pyrophosphatase or phosphodiesterase
MKKSILITFIALFCYSSYAQKKDELGRPKLVVGIVVDQMRYDYLYKYWDLLGDNGFKRFVNEGVSFENNHFAHVPTYTGPGHASVYTGSVPSLNGIVGNDWYEKSTQYKMYVTEDTTVKGIGTDNKSGLQSPRNLISTTVTDELRIFSNMRSKVVGVAIKDRGAILPAGHIANGAYWYDSETGNFVSSSFYLNELPDWAKNFNAKKVADSYLKGQWTPLRPLEEYKASIADDNSYELAEKSSGKSVFPYDLEAMKKAYGYGAISGTPFGNNMTLDFALAALEGESLGKDEHPDILAISFSSPDYLGHRVGPHAKEIQDLYLRLDLQLERLFKELDAKVGKNEYVVFLTADHGAAQTPAYMQSLNVPAGVFSFKSHKSLIDSLLKKKFGTADVIEYYINQQVYLNHELLEKNDKDAYDVFEFLRTEVLAKIPGVLEVINLRDPETYPSENFKSLIENSYYADRSGDFYLILNPGWFEGSYASKGGTTHSSGFTYDTHVPLLWYGKGISKGKLVRKKVYITDIAPTVSSILRISLPNASIGNPLEEVFEKEK